MWSGALLPGGPRWYIYTMSHAPWGLNAGAGTAKRGSQAQTTQNMISPNAHSSPFSYPSPLAFCLWRNETYILIFIVPGRHSARKPSKRLQRQCLSFTTAMHVLLHSDVCVFRSVSLAQSGTSYFRRRRYHSLFSLFRENQKRQFSPHANIFGHIIPVRIYSGGRVSTELQSHLRFSTSVVPASVCALFLFFCDPIT